MSSFLLNLARRSAGLPASASPAPSPSPAVREWRGPGLDSRTSDPDARGADLDAGETVTATPAPPGDSWPSTTPTIDEALPRPALQRLPATAESVASPSRTPMPGSAESRRLADTRTAPLAIDVARMHESAPLAEPDAAKPIPPPRLVPPAGLEPVRLAPPPSIAEPSTAHFTRDLSDVPASGEERKAASVSASAAARGGRGPDVVALVATTAGPATAGPVIRPAAAESPAPPRLAGATLAASPSSPPVHIRIGRVEVRGTAAPAPRPPASPPAPAAALGFAEYARMRTYRSWWR